MTSVDCISLIACVLLASGCSNADPGADSTATGTATAATTTAGESTDATASTPDSTSGSTSVASSISTTEPADSSSSAAGPDPTSGSSSGGIEPASTVLYVNFDGATLVSGAEDARTDTTSTGLMVGDVAPFGDGPLRQQVMDALGPIWSPFPVVLTDERPDDGEYTMVMLTPTNPIGGGLGLAPADCGNANPNNIAFVFSSAQSGHDPSFLAAVVSRQIGTTLGLDRVDASADLMNATVVEPDATFVDQCLPLSENGACTEQHLEHCAAGEQNSAAEVLGATSAE